MLLPRYFGVSAVGTRCEPEALASLLVVIFMPCDQAGAVVAFGSTAKINSTLD